MFLLLLFAFLAGCITILSPCILSIAPILLATGTEQSHYKPIGIITGLIISFSFFTLCFTAIIQATGISPDIFRYIALSTIIFFGLTMIIPSFENIFERLTAQITHLGTAIEKQATSIKKEFMSGLVLGIALGLIWTPCAGPVLATITAIAATGGITLTTILITIAYSAGAALPMLLICFGSAKIIRSTTKLAPYMQRIRQFFGIIIIATACAMIFHIDIIIQERLARFFPTITLEDNPLLHKELAMLNKAQSFEKTKIAPEIVGISRWLNSQPLTLAQLRGKVVLIDFWTYTCINCIRTLPFIKQWYTKYKDKGFEIIGVHTPEFAFEKNKSHVENAIKRFGITYPVALDNDYKTWQAYDNHYWPAHYLIDQHSMIVKTHFGEGDYKEMENAIRALLNMSPEAEKDILASRKIITPETYLGFTRGDRYQSSLRIQKDKPSNYHINYPLGDDQVGLMGNWTITQDCIKSEANNNSVELNFIAHHVYIVMQSDKPQLITVLLDEKPVPSKYYSHDMNTQGQILVHEPRMYELINLKNDYGRHTLTLQCQKGINAYVFTFGGENI